MKGTTPAIIIAAAIIGGAILLSGSGGGNGAVNGGNNVAVVDGVQVIMLTARGGYSPRTSSAQANIPSMIAMRTSGTYDCSSALVIPALKYQAYLPASGVTNIPVPAQPPGTVLRGSCAMGMYNFAIQFK